MVGNDIVDLLQANEESNWQRPRFLEKLFTESEQQLIQNSDDAFLMVWTLWSMKEAAYKLFTQINPGRFYDPKGFQCSFQDNYGVVRFKNFRCYTQSKITRDYIVSEARLTKSQLTSKVLTFNSKNVKRQSLILREKILELATKTFNIQQKDISFIKNQFNIPNLESNSRTINVSLSHHGKYGVYAIG